MKSPEPLSHQAIRNQNLSLVLGSLLRHDEVTRKQLEQESGLSKATVWRLVDDLVEAGAASQRSAERGEPGSRGRRPGAVRASSGLGTGVGLSLGVRTSSVKVTDLLGGELAQTQLPTPRWKDLGEAVDWAAACVLSAVEESPARLRRVVVAVPARAINGQVVARLPLFMSVIEGPEFGRLLADRLECPVRLETDASMILAGLEVMGLVDRGTLPVLLNLGSVLTMSLRRADGSIAEGRSSSFGDFGLIPVETELGCVAIGTLLGAHGLFETSQSMGRELRAMEDLWETDSDEVERLRRAFLLALERALRTIIVMSDPSEVVFTGRLVPLVARSLEEVVGRLATQVAHPPSLRVVEYSEEGRAAAAGAAEEAREGATTELLDRVARDGVEALR